MSRKAQDQFKDGTPVPTDNEAPPAPDSGDKPVKQRFAERLQTQTRIARFKGASIIEEDHVWRPMSSDGFAEVCYNLFGHGTNRSRINELEHLFRTTAEDLSDRAHLISFGDRVWDMRKLDWDPKKTVEDCVYRVPYSPSEDDGEPIEFIMDLACGDEGVYRDILQSVAPLIMDKKPTGVIWYLGGGANGKSTLVHLIYKIWGDYLTELTVKQLEDERDTPQLNGKIGNVCKESSEGFIEDTKAYKSVGTHEGFPVHKFHSQDMVWIEGNVHHIFSANNIPTFGDKSYGARRRTLVIPFAASFKPDETFEDKTFTKEFIERFLAEVIKYTLILKEQGYAYKFSETTALTKQKYDTGANTAQTYAQELINQDIHGFLNYAKLEPDYRDWCSENGYTPSSLNLLRKAMDEHGYANRSVRSADKRVVKMYLYGEAQVRTLEEIERRRGLFQLADSPYKLEAGEMDEEEQSKELSIWGKNAGNKDESTAGKEVGFWDTDADGDESSPISPGQGH